MRKTLADQYLSGSGIEIGGLHCPTPLSSGVEVIYVDQDPALMRQFHSDVVIQAWPQIVDDAGVLKNIPDNSQDFVIANHVLEHLVDPVTALHHWWRVLKNGGVLFCALPDKTQTFDRDRKVTYWHQCATDSQTIEERYYDWFEHGPDKKIGAALISAVDQAMRDQSNIHWWVWDEEEMKRLMIRPVFHLVDCQRNGAEIIWIMRANK